MVGQLDYNGPPDKPSPELEACISRPRASQEVTPAALGAVYWPAEATEPVLPPHAGWQWYQRNTGTLAAAVTGSVFAMVFTGSP